MFINNILNRYKEDKKLIDAFIDTMNNGRLKYLLRTKNPYHETIAFLKASPSLTLSEIETLDAVTEHRFYFEIRTYKVINL